MDCSVQNDGWTFQRVAHPALDSKPVRGIGLDETILPPPDALGGVRNLAIHAAAMKYQRHLATVTFIPYNCPNRAASIGT